ncbi:MAG: hypothetical protein JKY02_03655 [Flavobacteriaceae bacterium]|nr:hypothetical protein [Flavobacteriaceae bacterium]
MSFWKIVKGLRFGQITSLLSLFFKHPFFMFSTIRATLSVMKIAQNEFPNIHGELNKANAFRHALWNVLIAKECAKFSKNIESVIRWTEQITDWHEEFSPNEELPKFMDLHNNRVGREIYMEMNTKSKIEFIAYLKEQLNCAVQITSMHDVEKDSTHLVYLEN